MRAKEDYYMLTKISGENEYYAATRRLEIKKFLDNALKEQTVKNSEKEQPLADPQTELDLKTL